MKEYFAICVVLVLHLTDWKARAFSNNYRTQRSTTKVIPDFVCHGIESCSIKDIRREAEVNGTNCLKSATGFNCRSQMERLAALQCKLFESLFLLIHTNVFICLNIINATSPLSHSSCRSKISLRNIKECA